jgi:hypothetical protein
MSNVWAWAAANLFGGELVFDNYTYTISKNDFLEAAGF